MSLDHILNFIPGKTKPLLCLEVNPPRGTDLSKIFKRLDQGIDYIDFLNVTDSALARMKMNALFFASLLKNRYQIEPLVNIACRDRNSIALQSDLLAAWALGVRSCVALTGDALSVGDNQQAKAVFEMNSIGLLNLIQQLGKGLDLAGNPLNGFPEYCAGAVANPNAKNLAAEIKKLEKKALAGAKYILTQPVFSSELALEFLQAAKYLNIPIFLGLMPIATGKSVIGINNVPGIKIPQAMLDLAHSDSQQSFKNYSFDLAKKIVLDSYSQVCGFHVISGATPQLGLDFSKHIAEVVKGIC